MTPGMGVMAFNRALIRYGRRPFAVHAVLQIFYLGSRVLPGLLEKAVFDSITGQATLGVDIWALIAAYVGVGLARMASTYAETFAGWTFRYAAGAQVRRGICSRRCSGVRARCPIPSHQAKRSTATGQTWGRFATSPRGCPM